MIWPFTNIEPNSQGVIYADPPWGFKGYNSTGVAQRAENQHYDTMTIEGLAELPVSDLGHKDCALLMWSTSAHTAQAFWLAAQWGFRFSGKAFAWTKLNKRSIDLGRKCDNDSAYFMGMGHGTRKNTEDCWLFMKGKPKRIDRGVRELIVSPIREHSRKPDEAYGRIERLFSGPYCELFARQARDGWSSWGNETDKFKQTTRPDKESK